MKQDTFEPDGGLDYTRVLGGPGQRPTDMMVGLVAIVFGYLLVYPLLASAIVGVGWLVRGRPGDFADFSNAALAYQYPEGMVGGFVALAAFIVLAFALVRFVHHRRAAWLSSVRPGLAWWYLVGVAGAAAIILNTVYWATAGRTDFTWNPPANAWVWLVIVIVLAPLQAAGEEYLFRGYLMQLLGMAIKQRWLVVVISALVFTAMHGTQNLPLLLDRFAFGALMGALVVITGGLEVSIAAHAVNNVFAFGYSVLSGGADTARTLTEVSWATAGANIAGYALVGLVAWGIAKAMRMRTKTP